MIPGCRRAVSVTGQRPYRLEEAARCPLSAGRGRGAQGLAGGGVDDLQLQFLRGHRLRWAPLDHWNGRRSWRLADSAALRPAPGATPSFSDMLLDFKQFGSDLDAGGWKSAGAGRCPSGQPLWWAGLGERFLADTTGAGRADIVGLEPAKGAVTSSSRGDGTFDDERALHPPAPSSSPRDLWTVVDTTGDGRPDVVVLGADGVRVARPDEDGAFG